MLSFQDHFNGFDGQTCSYTTKFISDNHVKAKALGQNEVQYRQQLVQGHMGFLSGKWYQQMWDPGKVVMRAKFDNDPVHGKFTWSWTEKGKIKQKEILNGQEYDSELTWQQFDAFINKALNDKNYTVSLPTHRPPAVSPSSNSVGALTDEDAAILFVKTKDEFAKAKGINIQGANPALDLEVYESIAKVTGYTQNEIRLKIEAYKASGKKLSSLKKQVLAGKKDVKLPNPVEAKPDWQKELDDQFDAEMASLKAKSSGAKTFKDIQAEKDALEAATKATEADLDWVDLLMETDTTDLSKAGFQMKEHVYGDEPGWQVTLDGHDAGAITEAEIFGEGTKFVFDPKKKNGGWNPPEGPFDSLTDAKKAAKSHAEKEFGDAPDLVQPPEVHVAASQPAVKEAVADLKAKDAEDALVFSDEEIVKAYIKAKDHVAASDQNEFTLYSKGPEFDSLMRGQMKDYLQTSKLTQQQVDTAIANYLGAGNKISVLKKKMIKSGEMKKQAETLKQTKAEKLFSTGKTTSHAEAQAEIDKMASAAIDPVGSGNRHVFNVNGEQDVFDSLKNNVYASAGPETLYTKFYTEAAKWEKVTGDKVSTLDIIRIYDKKKAKQLGVENSFFYEKKMADWASTPGAQQKIYQIKNAATIEAEKQAKAKAAEGLINKDIPDLPADSGNFQAYTRNQSVEMQNRMTPWSSTEKSGLRTYTGGSYREINSYLRSGGYTSDSMKRTINHAQQAMRPTDVDMLTMRGCSYKQFGLDQGGYGWDAASHLEVKSLVGQEIQDKGFMSTSSASNYGGHSAAFGGVVRLEVEVPKGTYGAYVDHISMHSGENEYMVAAGTRFKVLRVTKEGSSTVVRVRAIPGSHTKGTL